MGTRAAQPERRRAPAARPQPTTYSWQDARTTLTKVYLRRLK
jgi:hypothetical protein